MADDHDDKTELPTEHRRNQMREQGNVARSVDLNAAALLLAAAVAMQMMGPGLVGALSKLMQNTLNGPAWTHMDNAVITAEFARLGMHLASAVLPMLGLLMVAGMAATLSQVGFLITTESLQPQFSRINPLEGFKRIFSIYSLVKLGSSLGKLTILGVVAGWYVWSSLPGYMPLGDADIATSAVVIGKSLIGIGYWLGGSLLAFALFDYGFQYWKFEQDLKMTKQELREEMRQMEGDPQIRSRRREAHRKMATSRQMARVPEADVVVTNPTEIAVAIKYDAETMAAPVVLAKGQGHLAARIRQLAAEHGVPIVEKKPLARALYRTVKVGHPIPLDLYEVVAEILAYVYRLNGKAKTR